MTAAARAQASLITPVLIGGSIILMLGFAVRASFGVFQIPIASEFGWARVVAVMLVPSARRWRVRPPGSKQDL